MRGQQWRSFSPKAIIVRSQPYAHRGRQVHDIHDETLPVGVKIPGMNFLGFCHIFAEDIAIFAQLCQGITLNLTSGCLRLYRVAGLLLWHKSNSCGGGVL